jgi:hypothetical protein
MKAKLILRNFITQKLILSAVCISALSTFSIYSAEYAKDKSVASDLGILVDGKFDGRKYKGGHYVQVNEYTLPSDYKQGNRLIAYEGPGWESDKVGYRLYLDERSVTDVWGKKLPAPVLHKVGRGENYHKMADWGMDVLKVGKSLGIGGLGYYKNGDALQVGKAQSLSAKRLKPSEETAGVRVIHTGLANGTKKYDLATDYIIAQDSRVTKVNARVMGDAPIMAAGLVLHKNVNIIEVDKEHTRSTWAYIGTYGKQSLNDDNLGLAMFYPKSAIQAIKKDEHSLFITFKENTEIEYAFAASWQGEPNSPENLGAFKTYMAETAAKLAYQASH